MGWLDVVLCIMTLVLYGDDVVWGLVVVHVVTYELIVLELVLQGTVVVIVSTVTTVACGWLYDVVFPP